ncbi:membrane-associated transporter protein isoform X2 [Anopheles aquasalis]|uniref:membrane-associated transporter protein isoform X2 n=1 Tax=Anopheles aquasalis TaxID=42839 RepID=UPI00215B5CE7|nr:membrane-associated transporter protein isoform X2 [Anopheles aquasalis]
MEKLHEYQGWSGRWHEWRASVRQRCETWREQHPAGLRQYLLDSLSLAPSAGHRTEDGGGGGGGGGGGWNENTVDFSHIYRPKTRLELVRVSAAVMGIEFSYAAETAFVSPTLLKIGVEHQHMTLVWCLSPLVGFFLTPVLGSLSDRCRSNVGRRRPFILLLSLGVLLGLLLVPNGEDLGYAMGDFNPYATPGNLTGAPVVGPQIVLPHRATASETELPVLPEGQPATGQRPRHPWGIFFTILGTVLLDFNADACQSPSRAFLLDVTVPEDHARGLSTFTIMAGLGGFMGYSLGGIDWDSTTLGVVFGGHVRAVFSLITIIFIVCVLFTATSFSEIPLWILEEEIERQEPPPPPPAVDRTPSDQLPLERTELAANTVYGATERVAAASSNDDRLQQQQATSKQQQQQQQRRYTMPAPLLNLARPIKSSSNYDVLPGENYNETSFGAREEQQTANGWDGSEADPTAGEPSTSSDRPAVGRPALGTVSLGTYLLSIVYMPHSLRMLCLTNLFCWMAHVCYSLYFTDFVGEAVFGGDPKALDGTEKYLLYEAGVRFGCWGMAMYSLSCACYSLVIERLIKRLRARRVYVGGLLFYCCGMAMMALTKHRVGVIVFSWTAGVMYSTLFTMPYLLVAHYHSVGVFEVDKTGMAKKPADEAIRGLGTDVAIVSSMVFLAQFVLSICMGSIVAWSGTTTAVVSVAALLSFCGAIAATQVMYLDL